MRLIDSFRLSVNNIAHRKLRAWLTLLGIVIGVAAVVAIISIGEGAQASINQRLSGFGADIITISPGGGNADRFMGGLRGANFGTGDFRQGGEGNTRRSNLEKEPTLTDKDVSVIKSNPNIGFVNKIVSGRKQAVFLSETTSTSIQGVDPLAWTSTSSLTLAAGRFLQVSDSGVAVIGNRLANSTFKQPITLGRKITVNSKPFTVVGILGSASSSTGGFGGGGDNTIYINYRDAWEAADVNKGTYSSLQAKARDKELMQETVSSLTTALQFSRKVTERNQDFGVTSSEAIKQQIESVTQALTLFLGAIAAVSLIVGAVGVANSMFTSVLEKTHEIGIMKALGSTDAEILQLFIIESALFGFIGGAIGAAIGTGISALIPLMAGGIMPGMGNFTTLVTPALLISAVLLSTIIGIISGIMPARSASKLRPIEALRHE